MKKYLAALLAALLLPTSAFAAIAFNTSSGVTVGTSPRLLSYTATGSNIWMVICAYDGAGLEDSSNAASFNGSNLTQYITGPGSIGNYGGMSVWAGPVNSGTANISVSATTTIGYSVSTYTGVLVGVEQSTSTAIISPVNSLTVTYTPLNTTNWAVLCTQDGGSNPSAGTNSTQRQSGLPGGTGFFDSNGTSATNPFSMTFTWTGGIGGQQTGSAAGVVLTAIAASTPYVPNTMICVSVFCFNI